jgi:hypothetical protein
MMDTLKNLAAAKIKATATLPKLERDKPGARGRYATLANVLDTIREPFANAGLTFLEGVHRVNDEVVVEVTLVHAESGEMVTHHLPLPGGNTAQTIGSAITYGRRYLLMTMAGIAPDDDDGEMASQAPQAKPTQRPQPAHRQAPRQPTGPQSWDETEELDPEPNGNGSKYTSTDLIADSRAWNAQGDVLASPQAYGFLGKTIDALTAAEAHKPILSKLAGHDVDHENRPGKVMVGNLLNKLLEQTKDRTTKQLVDNPNFDPATVDAIKAMWQQQPAAEPA